MVPSNMPKFSFLRSIMLHSLPNQMLHFPHPLSFLPVSPSLPSMASKKPPSPNQEPYPPHLPHPKAVVSTFKHHHRHVLQLALIVTACMVCVIMFLFTVSLLIRHFYSRRYNRNRNTRHTPTPILFDLNADSPTSDNDDHVDEEDLAVLHPIWYIRTVGLQQSLIDSITVFRYRKDDGIIDSSECSVCLGEFQQDESLRLLPKCSHAFHVPCIDTWLGSHKNCPLCRAPVVHDEPGGAQVRAVDPNDQTDSNVSDHQNQEAQVENSDDGVGVVEDGGSGVPSSGRVTPDHKVLFLLPNSSSAVEEETPPRRRSVSVDFSSASMVVDIDTLNGEKVSSSNKGKTHMMSTEKHGSSSTTIHKLASIGRALQKGPVSMRRSFSHNRKFLYSTHCRSQSSTLPL